MHCQVCQGCNGGPDRTEDQCKKKIPHLNFMLRTAIVIVNHWGVLVSSNVNWRTYGNHQMILRCSMPLISFLHPWTVLDW